MNDKPVERNQMVFPFADTPAIVRSQQKDAYFEQHLAILIQDIIKSIKGGNRFLAIHSTILIVLSKLIYLSVTTLSNKRTLGEQYVDLLYAEEKRTSKNFQIQRLASFRKKIVFVISYCLFPVVIDKLINTLTVSYDNDDQPQRKETPNAWKVKLLKLLRSSYVLTELNLAIFYLTGKYYTLSKRFFGLRYIFGHQINEANSNKNSFSSSLGYKILGSLMILKIIMNHVDPKGWWSTIRHTFLNMHDVTTRNNSRNENNKVYDVKSAIEKSSDSHGIAGLNLANSNKLPFLENRTCMFCLNDMRDPTCLKCGHVSCWNCIMSWCQDNTNSDCPLCRTPIEKQFIPIK